jgi:hypothetical protein
MDEKILEVKVDSSEARKAIHKLIDELADLADGGSNSAAGLLIDFGEYGTAVVATRGLVPLDQIVTELNEEECSDPSCKEHHETK